MGGEGRVGREVRKGGEKGLGRLKVSQSSVVMYVSLYCFVLVGLSLHVLMCRVRRPLRLHLYEQ